MKDLLKKSQTPPDIARFKQAPLDVMIKAYKVAPAEQQAKYKAVLGAKVENKVKRGEMDELQPYIKDIQEIFGTMPEPAKKTKASSGKVRVMTP